MAAGTAIDTVERQLDELRTSRSVMILNLAGIVLQGREIATYLIMVEQIKAIDEAVRNGGSAWFLLVHH